MKATKLLFVEDDLFAADAIKSFPESRCSSTSMATGAEEAYEIFKRVFRYSNNRYLSTWQKRNIAYQDDKAIESKYDSLRYFRRQLFEQYKRG
jgi:hypothetical protein